MRKLFYLFISVLFLTACQQEESISEKESLEKEDSFIEVNKSNISIEEKDIEVSTISEQQIESVKENLISVEKINSETSTSQIIYLEKEQYNLLNFDEYIFQKGEDFKDSDFDYIIREGNKDYFIVFDKSNFETVIKNNEDISFLDSSQGLKLFNQLEKLYK